MIEPLITDLVATHVQSRGDDLVGFVIDADALFEDSDAFGTASVTSTPHPERLVDILVASAPEIRTLQALATSLLDVWQSLSYQHFSATSLTHFREATDLRFATVISAGAFYVTGNVRVTGDHRRKQVERYERSFGPLPSLEADGATG
jgi:hypothetical protein